MHTIKVVAGGVMLLVIFAVVGRLTAGARGMATAALVFAPVWFVCSGINMYLGVKRAGYSFADETPIFMVVFLVPGTAAFLSWWAVR